MKRLGPSLFLFLLFTGAVAMTGQKKTRVVFFGDSITQMGTDKGGYLAKLNEVLAKKGLAAQYEIIGSGIGYNKVYDLYLRMDDDVLAKAPNVVVIWIGVNDVGHKASTATGTDPDRFERFYEAIIKKLQARNIRVVLTTPAVIGERTDYSNPQDGDLNYYSHMVRSLAKKHKLELVDMRKAFLEYNLKKNAGNKYSGVLTTDGIHLNDTGNQLAADLLLSIFTTRKG